MIKKIVCINDFTPRATPRPKSRVRHVGKRCVPDIYLDQWYIDYKQELEKRLYEANFFDDTLAEIISSFGGVAVKLLFEVPFGINQINKGDDFVLTKPDLDNLQKGVLDTIFGSKYLPKNIYTDKNVDDARVTYCKCCKIRTESKEDLGSITIEVAPTVDLIEEEGF